MSSEWTELLARLLKELAQSGALWQYYNRCLDGEEVAKMLDISPQLFSIWVYQTKIFPEADVQVVDKNGRLTLTRWYLSTVQKWMTERHYIPARPRKIIV